MEELNIQSSGGKQTYAIKTRRKRHNLGTGSCLSASDESQNGGGITVYSINFAKSSRSIKIKL